MAVFTYEGLSAAGKSIAGSVESGTEKGALDLLESQGILPVELRVSSAREAASRSRTPAAAGAALQGFGRGRVPIARRTQFVRELATFLHADIPLLEAVAVQLRQEAHPGFHRVLQDVHDRVRDGEAFSRALARHPRVFPPLLVSMARVGEAGGMLGAVLDQMAHWMEQEEEVRSEIRSALAYPLVIVAMGVVTVIILLSFVLPRISTIFVGMETDLPAPTRMLMAVGDFMGVWWWTIPLACVAMVFAIARALKNPVARRLLDRAVLRVPVMGALALKASVSRFARASAALLGAGVPLLETLRTVRGLVGNMVIASLIDDSLAAVTRGEPLARSLGKAVYFPPSVVHLLSVGERTGRLAEMFERVAGTFEKQRRAQIKVMLDLLSPLLIVALAALVALIAISILLPIFQMNKLMR